MALGHAGNRASALGSYGQQGLAGQIGTDLSDIIPSGATQTQEPPLPSRLTIGFRRYRLEWFDKVEAARANKWGEHSPHDKLIRVERVDAGETVNTLLHEIMHACYDVAEIDEVASPTEEFMIGTLTNQLTKVMQDNPELRTWLMWAWAQED